MSDVLISSITAVENVREEDLEEIGRGLVVA